MPYPAVRLFRALAASCAIVAVAGCATLLDLDGESSLRGANDGGRTDDSGDRDSGTKVERDGGGGGDDASSDAFTPSCPSCAGTSQCCAPRVCGKDKDNNDRCCSPDVEMSCGLGGDKACCAPLSCTAAKRCKATCSSKDGACNGQSDCCLGAYCDGGKCVACLANGATCAQGYQCCSLKCENQRCEND